MTLYEIISSFQKIALTQPNILTAKNGNVYDIMNNTPSNKYGVFVVTQNTHSSDENTDTYGLTLYCIDRLDDTLEDNRLSIQSICKEQLENIIKTFCDMYELDIPEVNYTPFTQKFVDECAGVYAQFSIVLYGSSCLDGGVVSRPGIKFLQENKYVFIDQQNSTTVVIPDEGYDAMEKVTVDVCIDLSEFYKKDEVDELIQNASDENKAYTDEKIEEVNNTINEEIERATEAENRLSEEISNETERAEKAEKDLDDKIEEVSKDLTDEIERATAKEGELDNKITAETERATNKENELNTKIEDEVSRATAKEGELDSKIEEEISRATSKEVELQQSITNIENNITNNYYTKEETDSQISQKIEQSLGEDGVINDKIDEKLTGYATEKWVEDKHYLTEHQSLEDYYTKSEIDGKGYVTHDDLDEYADKSYVDQAVEDAIEDIPTEFKTINGQSILGSGNIEITSGGGTIAVDGELSETSENPVQNKVITNKLNEIEGEFEGVTDKLDEINEKVVNIPDDIASKDDIQSAIDGQQFKTINGQSIKGSGNIQIEGGGESSRTGTYLSEMNNLGNQTQVQFTIKKFEDSSYTGNSTINVKTINGQPILGKGNIEVSGTVTVDSEMSDTSKNPVENQAIKKYIDSKISGLDNFFVECVDGSLTTISADMWYGRAAEQIRDYAFYNYTTIKSAYIPEIKRLGDHAFEGCSSLNEIHCTGKAGSVGTDAFKGVAEVGTLYYPQGEDYSEWCNALPEGWNCFPEGTYLILGQYSIDAPSEGSSTIITVESSSDWHIDSNPDWCSISTASNSFTVNIGESDDARNGEIVVYNEDGLSKNVSVEQEGSVIPDNEIHYRTINNIGINFNDSLDFGATFVENKYENDKGILRFESAVTKVPDSAFKVNTTISNIKLPKTVIEIGTEAFANMPRLTRFDCPKQLETIGMSALSKSAITSLKLNDGLKTIRQQAFYGCSSLVGNVEIPNTVTRIESGAFYADNTTDLLYSISFEEGGNEELVIANENNLMFSVVFGNLANTELIIPDRFKTVKPNAFTNFKNIQKIKIGDGVETLCALPTNYDVSSATKIVPTIYWGGVKYLNYYNRAAQSRYLLPRRYGTVYFKEFDLSDTNFEIIGYEALGFSSSVTIDTPLKLPSTLKKVYSGGFANLRVKEIYCYAQEAPEISRMFGDAGSSYVTDIYVPKYSDYSSWVSEFPDAMFHYDL